MRENFSKTVKAGVKVAFGTDAGVSPHGDSGRALQRPALVIQGGRVVRPLSP